MTTSKKLKIWTIITHALIVVGFGHGIIIFGLIEIFRPYITKNHFSVLLNAPFEVRLSMVVLTTFLGHSSLVYSILAKNDKRKRTFHLLGLVFLWLSILYFTVDLKNDHYVHFGTVTAIPFLICTLIVFVGQPLKRAYKSALDE